MKFKNKLILCISLIVILPSLVYASQLSPSIFNEFHIKSSIGTRILKDEVPSTLGISTDNQSTLKSPNEAFLYSLIIPGLGQINNGAKHGYIYTVAEVGLLTTYFILRNSAANTRENYRDIVRDHVIFIGPGNFENWDPIEDFEHATQYENWNHVYDSDATRDRTGKWYWKDLDPTLKDEKDTTIEFDSKYRLEAFELREEANNTFQTARTVLGVVILNHIVSAVEARISTKLNNNQQLQNSSIEIETNTDISSGSFRGVLALKKRF
ncbi:hypothetical protein JT359_20725 [Candidatus Poribacteria bacterium]|nr:hypothetical protein [Candidatus Poribacteria bacterium]